MNSDSEKQSYDYMAEFRKTTQNNHLHPWVAAREGFMVGYEQGKLDESNYRACLKTLTAVTEGKDGEIKMLLEASRKVGGWLSAALEDPGVCEEMKNDVRAWFTTLSDIGGIHD